MSHESRPSRGLLHRSAVLSLAVATAVVFLVAVEKNLNRRFAWSQPSAEEISSSKMELGLNAGGGDRLILPGSGNNYLPIVSSLSPRHRSVLGLLLLGGAGFLASIRPFESSDQKSKAID